MNKPVRGRVSGSGAQGSEQAKPDVGAFERILESIACDQRVADDKREWVRDSLPMVGEKVRALRYILDSSSPGNRRVLDVGAQIGAFALFAAEMGCQVSGVDYDFYAGLYGTIARERGVDYRKCDVGSEPLPFADNSFEFVTYTDVIEHHAFSPKRVLQEIHRVLAPGGRLVMTTPNHASIYNRVSLLLGKSVNDQFDSFFHGAEDAKIYFGHHREYTRAELRQALEGAGFRVVECRVIEEDFRSYRSYLRSSDMAGREVPNRKRWLVVRALGVAWEGLGLPFGRVLWAVGEKPGT